MNYDPDNCREEQLKSIEAAGEYRKADGTTWLNIDGLHQVEIIEKIGQIYDLHPLLLEDILNTNQRPKVEQFDNCIFAVVKMISYDDQKQCIQSEQVSFVLVENHVISFQERVGDVFGPVRDRIQNTRWRIRKLGADYLFYALVDSIVDYYFTVLDKIAERIEVLQDEVTLEPTEKTIQKIHELKREMLFFRRAVSPIREMVNSLQRDESKLISDATRIYLRDVYDHTIQVTEAIETYREMIGGLHDTYLSSISNRMNAVMKVLTIIATIFIPLTFVAGIYGMNFDYMPELHWRWSYPAVWIVMAAMFVVMMLYFKKKKWL